MTAYYNENDKKAAQWLRNLIAAGYIAPGDVDDRSIEDVKPSDLIGYTQCHFFAGIGIWSDSLRRAGWSDERPVWTGSCPCQPFSAAGKGLGVADERHLWPAWEWLIRHAKPRSVPVFGEQVASKDGLAWLDVVQADLEGQGYTVRALDLCAAGVGAPHIRQRLYFVADTNEGRSGGHSRAVPSTQSSAGREVWRLTDGVEPSRAAGIVAESGDERREGERLRLLAGQPRQDRAEVGRHGEAGLVADADGRHASAEGLQRSRQHGQQPQDGRVGRLDLAAGSGRKEGCRSDSESQSEGHGSRDAVLVGHADDAGSQGRSVSGADRERVGADQRTARATSPVNGFWSDADWLPCLDGKARPVEPGTFPLAHGAEGRVVRLRAYGNAIVAPLAEEFIRAYLG